MPPNSTKSSVKLSHTSLQSTSSSVSNAAKSSAKAIGHGLKHIKKGTTAIIQPLKWAKLVPSNILSPAISELEDNWATEQSSLKTNDLPEVIDLESDEELEDLEKELGPSKFSSYLVASFQFTAMAKETWKSPIYLFFKSEVTIEVHKGCLTHFFTCSAKKCKTGARGVQRFQDTGDKSSTANLCHHAVHCFSEDTVNEAVRGESGGSWSGNIFSAFASQGKCPVTYSHHPHSTPEFQII